MTDTDYYTYADVKADLALSSNDDQTLIDRYGVDATQDTDNFFKEHTTTPFTGSAITEDVKKRTDLLVEEWFKKYIHQYKAASELRAEREKLEARMIAYFVAVPSTEHTPTAYAQVYRSEPLASRSGL